MLSVITFEPQDKVLDLGCGYAPARVVMVDNDPIAVAVARRNADANGVPSVTVRLSDGLRDTPETGFTKVISNPPYHVDFSAGAVRAGRTALAAGFAAGRPSGEVRGIRARGGVEVDLSWRHGMIARARVVLKLPTS